MPENNLDNYPGIREEKLKKAKKNINQIGLTDGHKSYNFLGAS